MEVRWLSAPTVDAHNFPVFSRVKQKKKKIESSSLAETGAGAMKLDMGCEREVFKRIDVVVARATLPFCGFENLFLTKHSNSLLLWQ